MEKKDWKIRQELYHRLHKEHKDNLYGYDILMSDDIVNDAIDYFNENEMPFIYPAKSYVVAICYATWLARDFKEDFYDLLRDKELLYNNDPYFKTYEEDKDTYDKIIEKVLPFDENKGIVPDIKEYYKAEFFDINIT